VEFWSSIESSAALAWGWLHAFSDVYCGNRAGKIGQSGGVEQFAIIFGMLGGFFRQFMALPGRGAAMRGSTPIGPGVTVPVRRIPSVAFRSLLLSCPRLRVTELKDNGGRRSAGALPNWRAPEEGDREIADD